MVRDSVGSAPELPHAIAKEYGLHRDEQPKPVAANAREVNAELDAVVASAESAESDQSDAPTPVKLDDSKTDAAVDDILTKESDQLLKINSGTVPHVQTPVYHRGFWASIGRFFSRWWRNKWARWITILIVAGLLTAVGVWQQSRYAILNATGVRSSASVIVLDDTTQLPLKNVNVSLDGHTSLTGKDGVATFKDLKLGDYSLTIKRIAFAPYKQHITIGWGSNPLGSFKLKATGTQYTLLVSDYISGKGVVGAEATSDQTNALSDKNGKIILTVDSTDVTTLNVTVSAAGYRSQAVVLDASSAVSATLVLVPSVKEVYVSKQSGRYDVYSSDVDGQNKKLVLAGSGNENSNISLVVSPDGKRAALVSTRDNIKDADGYTLQTLTIIDLAQGTSVTVDHSEQLQLVDWIGNRLIYRMTLAGASASDPQRNRLISYSYDSNARVQLATANQFNAVVSSHGYVYYTVSGTDPQATLGLFRVKADGSDRKRLSQDEIWTIIRTSYNVLALQTPNGWQTYEMANDKFSSSDQPSNLASRTFIDDTQAKRSLWVDTRDGRGVLLVHAIAANSDKLLQTQDGITTPMRWADDNVVIYRVVTNGETADYAISPDGGSAHKIADVTATYGYAQIY